MAADKVRVTKATRSGLISRHLRISQTMRRTGSVLAALTNPSPSGRTRTTKSLRQCRPCRRKQVTRRPVTPSSPATLRCKCRLRSALTPLRFKPRSQTTLSHHRAQSCLLCPRIKHTLRASPSRVIYCFLFSDHKLNNSSRS